MSVGALVEALEATPLLGEGVARARALEEQIARALRESPDPLLSLRALIRRGERQLACNEEGAAETLAEAARWAMSLGEPRLELRCRLLTARALAEAGSLADAQALLRRAEQESAGVEDLALDRALARAAAGLHGVAEELTRAILSATGRPQDRLAAAVRVSEARAGSDWREAERWSLYAQGLAEAHGEAALARRLELQRGALLLRHGRPADAIAPLERAFDADDGLVRLAAGLLLSGLYLDRAELERAEAIALLTLTLAESRRNWLAFSAAALDRARCAALQGGDPEIVLRDALLRCRSLGEPGALLQARLLELREVEPAAPAGEDE